MFESGDNSNHNYDANSKGSFSNLDSEQNLDNIDANLSAKNVAIRKKQLEQLFVRLIAFGLAFGAILGIGTYYLINRFGLNKKPYQLEQEKIELEKQEQASFPKISAFPYIPESLELSKQKSENSDINR